MVLAVDGVMNRITKAYARSLDGALNTLPVIVVFACLVLGSIGWLYTSASSELAPAEDQGIILAQSISAPNATLQQKQLYGRQTFETFSKHPETETVFQIDSTGTGISGWVLKPWDQRKATDGGLAAGRPLNGRIDRDGRAAVGVPVFHAFMAAAGAFFLGAGIVAAVLAQSCGAGRSIGWRCGACQTAE